ncbi:MAG: MmgE/PrpD family protein [Ilumatobacteraceae bacterium]
MGVSIPALDVDRGRAVSGTARVGRWVASIDWSNVPEGVWAAAHRSFWDTVGCIIGGFGTTSARICAEVAAREPGVVKLPFGRTAPLAMGALAYASAASALDLDDGHYEGGAIHPGSVIVSSLLASAPQEMAIGTLLRSQIVGYEVALRAARILWPRDPSSRYHCTGTAGALGAAAACAHLAGADAGAVSRAIATAWGHAPMSSFQLPMIKESIAWAAATGVVAAELSRAGFMASTRDVPPPDIHPPTPFDEMPPGTDVFVDSLGSVYETANVYLKPFAACRYTHAAAESLRRLVADRGNASISEVVVGTHRNAVFLDDPKPPTLDHAQYSYQFVLAAILQTGAAGVREMSETALDDRARLAWCERIRVVHDPTMDELTRRAIPVRSRFASMTAPWSA